MDYLLRPVAKGLCRYESLLDGTLSLEDILIMNVYLDNEAYNTEKLNRSLDNG